MAKYCLKKSTKRVSCKKRYRIEKKVRDHNRKLRKETKLNSRRKSAQKPISIPNKCPFKEELLAEAERVREEAKQQKLQKKLEAKTSKEVGKKRKLDNTDSLEEIRQKAAKQAETYVPTPCIVESLDVSADKSDKSTRVFAGEVRKTIESADIVLEVLDARDPLGSRNRSIEESVIRSGKRLVLLLNKIDLVPKENVQGWLAYLRKELPTIAFKASTQEQNKKLGRYITSVLEGATSKCVGADLVMKLLNNYCRNKGIKTSIRVGVIGYPNVGKSSVINSLKRKKSCQTGATPGLTRQLQEVELDKHIRLIDSPGVVLASKTQFDPVEVALKNALRVEALQDPVAPVHAILRRCSVKVLMLHFNIPEFNNCDEFLALLARKLGRMKKGGRPDLNAAARHVLNEWNSGHLRYYTQPPEAAEEMSEGGKILSSELLQTFSQEFDLDALEGDVKTLVDALPEDEMHVETVYDKSIPVPGSESEAEMDVDGKGETATVVTAGTKKKEKLASNDDVVEQPQSFEIDGNVQLNRVLKMAAKKKKKQQKKTANRANKLGDSLASLGNDVEMDD